MFIIQLVLPLSLFKYHTSVHSFYSSVEYHYRKWRPCFSSLDRVKFININNKLSIFFQIFGIVIIAAACVDMGMIKGFAGMEPTGHETDALLIAIGVLIIIIAAFGCFGAWKESPKLLYIVSSTFIIHHYRHWFFSRYTLLVYSSF